MLEIFENVPFFPMKNFPWKIFHDGNDQRCVFKSYCLIALEDSGPWVLVYSESETFGNLTVLLTE